MPSVGGLPLGALAIFLSLSLSRSLSLSLFLVFAVSLPPARLDLPSLLFARGSSLDSEPL